MLSLHKGAIEQYDVLMPNLPENTQFVSQCRDAFSCHVRAMIVRLSPPQRIKFWPERATFNFNMFSGEQL